MVHAKTITSIGLVWNIINIVGLPLCCMMLTAIGVDFFCPNGCLLGVAAVPYLTTDLQGGNDGVLCPTWNLY